MRSPSMLSSVPAQGSVPVLYVAFLERTSKTSAAGWRMRLASPGTPGAAPVQETFQMSTAELANTLIKGSLCKGEVDPDYVRNQVRNNDIFFVLFYDVEEQSTRRTARSMVVRVPAAFVMARIVENKDLYIDVVCAGDRQPPHYARHNGGMLIGMAVKLAQDRGLEQVSLSALPPVLTYYPRFDFAHRPSCSQPADVALPQVLKDRAKAGTLPKTLAAAYDDDDLLDFMSELQLNKYGTKYESDCATRGKTKLGVKASMKNARCGDNGFKMRLCLAGATASKTPPHVASKSVPVPAHVPAHGIEQQASKRTKARRSVRLSARTKKPTNSILG